MIEQKQFLTEDDIKGKLAYLDSLNGKEPDREVLLAGIAHKYIWHEVWSRETGHMWEKYFPAERTPTEKELDFADLESEGSILVGNVATSALCNMFEACRKEGK